MIDYIPPDIPPAVVKYVDEHYKAPSYATGRWFKYLTIWKNQEVYAFHWKYNKALITGLPPVFIYDCHDVRKPTLEEVRDIHWFMPKYLMSSKIKAEHLCHRDLEAFNQHNTPNPYKKKVKYFTPKYIPKPVVKYIDEQYPISWYPGAYERHVKYLTTYQDKYEVYFVYWNDPINKKHSKGKYVLYNCKNIRGYKDNKERIELISLKSSDELYNTNAIPKFCKSNKKTN